MPARIDWRDRITVIAIGVSNYEHLRRLHGSDADVYTLQNLLVHENTTALIHPKRFRAILDPTSAGIREAVAEYAFERSAPGDILIFYFSGHGVPIGRDDLGLCGRDTLLHMEYGTLPIDTVRFRDLIETLTIVKVHPVVIIDACFSGQAAETLSASLGDNLNEEFIKLKGTDYALLCSSTRLEVSLGFTSGGVFSSLLNTVALRGLGGRVYTNKSELTLKDLIPDIQMEAESSGGASPVLIVGDALPAFGFVKNTQHRPRTERLTQAHKKVLDELWNEGKPREMSIRDLAELGISAHSTYRKLGYGEAWALIENVDSRTRRLSKRGVLFMQGKLKIPRKIKQNPENRNWEAAEGAESVAFGDI
jgi:hypothetical protein